MEVKEAKTRADIEFCKEVILQFRTNLKEDNYVDQIIEMMNEEGFKLHYIPNDTNTKAVAFIGYRPLQMLRTGKIIYIDDLFTSSECRSKGFAGLLLDHVTKEAETTGIQSVHLDSGYMLHDAHRLYLNKGYVLACNHFAKKIS
ncbi:MULTISPECIES: GNAT family N-acetyltransferase [Chryseobacterium]|uniref:GNAT family N-acetyltransferase n=1 Tax=Chryseobacterium TaxID=59732 RepID=UPI0027A5D9E7|nr:GNAT family N-acetyltransferase [Chryseobacterium daecheongense]